MNMKGQMGRTERLAAFFGVSERQVFNRLAEGHEPTCRLAVAFWLHYDGGAQRLESAVLALRSAAAGLRKLGDPIAREIEAIAKRITAWLDDPLFHEVREAKLVDGVPERRAGMSEADYAAECLDHENYRREVDGNVRRLLRSL